MAQAQVQPQVPVSGAGTVAANGVGVGQFPSTLLYVGDLEMNVTDSQLFDLFSQAGHVLFVRVCRDMNTRRSLGYAYVNFGNAMDAARALDMLNFIPLNNKPIRIKYSNGDPSAPCKSGTANLFVKVEEETKQTFYEFPSISCENMAKVMDRTEDFKDAIRALAVSSGYTESKLAAIMATFIMRKPTHRLPFTKAALKTLESINELENFIKRHRNDYLNLRRTTEQERDDIEHEVGVFVKACKEQIEILKNRIYDEKNLENSTRWLPILNDGSHADEVAHKHGVVLILSERLHSVTAKFDQLRSVRIQNAVNRAMPRRNKHSFRPSKSSEVLKSDLSKLAKDEISPEPVSVQGQLLDDETRALQVELSSLLDAVHETETKMVEMSALNHLMSMHVLQQAQQIELLYEQAVEATKNVVMGNKELTQAIQRNSSSRTFLLLFFFVLTFSVIFLDWYS